MNKAIASIVSPAAVFLGDATDPKSIKTASGLLEWTDYVTLEIACSNETVSTNKLPRAVGLDEMVHNLKVFHIRTLIITAGRPGDQTLSPEWEPYFRAAINLGVQIINPLHSKFEHVYPSLSGDVCNIRYNDHLDIKVGRGIKRPGYRVLTIGQDSNIGKKYTSMALCKVFNDAGIPNKFRPTGQTGRMIAKADERSIVMDTMHADYMTGAAEYLTPANDGEWIDVIEGQGSIDHPSFAPGAVALLTGCQPDELILCVDPLRTTLRGTNYPVSPLGDIVSLSLKVARRTNPLCHLSAVSVQWPSTEQGWEVPWVGLPTNTSRSKKRDCYIEYLHDELRRLRAHSFFVVDPNDPGSLGTLASAINERYLHRSPASLIHTNSRAGDWK